MKIEIDETKARSGAHAATDGAERIRQALKTNGNANIILATGASQFDMLAALVAADGIDWRRVTVFHLDEYAGMPVTHPASFRKYLIERFVEKLPVPPAAFHAINAEGDLAAECARLGKIIRKHPIDVAFIGIGENGHVAFNDPPADFTTDEPYLVVALDEPCRRQQLGEGWFPALADVPTHAISMSVRQIMLSAAIVCTVPDERKAKAVRGAVKGPVTPMLPASILQTHDFATLYLDRAAASQLGEEA
ncbi:MAG: glucosamine-6-phosphate deaminase [Capsulimonadaceae bacterium]|nr:glucosamine-6-phosphate deaminase [Capsulimonadaceae bacterium]